MITMNIILNTKIIYEADAYFRLSKEDGDREESDSIVNQKSLIREFIQSNPDIHIYKERVDDGYTGVNFERPGFQAVLEDIQSGKVNCVIVKDLSRFGRNYIEAGRYIERIFPYFGVRFIAINDNIDTLKQNNSSDEMIIPFKNLINDAYCRDISIKVRSHLDIKRKRGEFIGAFAPYGYKKSAGDKNQLEIDEIIAPIIKNIFMWKLKGMSSSHIADKLNELGVLTPMEYKHSKGEKFYCGFRTKANTKWDAHGVNHILKNEIYLGVLLQGKTTSFNYKVRKRVKKEREDWIRCENSHKEIISKEMFIIVQKLLNEDTRTAPNKKMIYLFSGIVKCGHCKGNMTRKIIPNSGKKYIYLICVENKNSKICNNNKYFRLDKFESIVLKVINMQIEKVIQMEKMISPIEKLSYNNYAYKEIEKEIVDKQSQMEKLHKHSFSLYEDYKSSLLSEQEYKELKTYYIEQTIEINRNISNLEQEKKEIVNNRLEKLEWLHYFIKHKGFKVLARDLLVTLIDEIFVYGKERIEIVFRFKEE